MTRIAAVGDLHVSSDTRGTIAPTLSGLADEADMLLLAGDLTQHGLRVEAEALAAELAAVEVPILAVLGNHDYHSCAEDEIRAVLAEVGVTVLEGEAAVVTTAAGVRVGVGGSKGFGGGFLGACGTEFGEQEMKAFMRHTKGLSERLFASLADLDSEIRVALLHYAPIEGTLQGERREIYPFLGCYMLGEAVDRSECHLALHGHAHRGIEHGVTPGGTPVRNVARPVIRAAYRIYELHSAEHGASPEASRVVIQQHA